MRLIGPVLASYPVGGEEGAEGGAYVSLRMGMGLGQGGADGGQLQDCGSVACGGEEFLARAGAGAGQDGGG